MSMFGVGVLFGWFKLRVGAKMVICMFRLFVLFWLMVSWM